MINASSLPLEITTRIAEKLEYHDLQSFALTCRAWEDAAELYIYEELDLSVDNVADPDYFDNDGIYDVAEEIQKTLFDRWTRMLEAIQSRPVRAKMVRYIDFAMVFGLSDLLSTLIELTHRVLLEVSFSRIKSHDGLGNQRNNEIHEAMYAAVRKCPVLERVHTATFGLAYNWEHQLRSAARFCPNVVTLDICISDDLDEPGDMDQMTWLRFPALRHLTINHDVETPIAYLTPILRHNPDIELFEFLHDHDGFRLTNHCADAVAELRQHQSISRLVWCVKGTAFHSSRGLFDGTGFESLKWLTFDASIYSESETYLEVSRLTAVFSRAHDEEHLHSSGQESGKDCRCLSAFQLASLDQTTWLGDRSSTSWLCHLLYRCSNSRLSFSHHRLLQRLRSRSASRPAQVVLETYKRYTHPNVYKWCR